MKKYDILEDFKGSQDGAITESFKKGQEGVSISDSLAEVALKEGWITESKEAKPAKKTQDK